MPSLSYFLERTDQSLESIQSLKFDAPGIFTNAIVTNPEITKLLKDPSHDENSLYRIGRDGDRNVTQEASPQRVDGIPFHVNQSFNDQSMSKGTPDRRTAVVFPKIIERADRDSELASSPRDDQNTPKWTSLLRDGEGLGVLLESVLDTIDKYPNLLNDYDNLVTKLMSYKKEHDLLDEEIQGLENEIQHQREELNYLNINYSDINSPLKSGSDFSQLSQNEDGDKIDIDEYLEREENEIKELERKLMERQR